MESGAIQAPLPSPSTPLQAVAATDIHELLLGLDADDFDDFDDIEQGSLGPSVRDDAVLPPHSTCEKRAHDDTQRQRESTRVAPVDKPGSASPYEDYDDNFTVPPPGDTPAVVSFATAAGKTLAPPSEAAMSRALKIMRDAERDLEVGDEGDGPGPSKRRRVDEPSMPTSTPVAQIRDALAELRNGLDGGAEQVEDEVPVASTITPGGFQLGSGRAAPDPSDNARARALALFTEDDDEAAIPSHCSADNRSAAKSGFQLGSGFVPPTQSQSVARALAIFNDDHARAGPSTRPGTPTRSMAFRPPTTPLLSGSPAVARRLLAGAPLPPSTPSRAPLQTTTNTFATPRPATPSQTKLSRGIEIKGQVGTPRRIGLGFSTPGSARGKARKGFSTPFKPPGAVTNAKFSTPLSSLRVPVKPPTPVKTYEPVFDLNPPADRESMREAYLYPGFYTEGDMLGMGLPNEIWTLGLTNAIYYQFVAEDASMLGNKEAFQKLKRDKCELATQKWVDNHWAMILWKIAGQVSAKPTLYDEKWNWYEVICQLKYRYEREYGAALRPLVRRIQEHDSSPSLPMVLCVAGVYHPEPILDEKDEPVPQRPYLSLTDGWYQIRATVDDCLARAIVKGKIRVGRKLGISGAKLESGADGNDALDAFEKSNLVLSGNSTHFAKWDARLGQHALPFIAGLSSLSVDGGSVVLMDIVLDRVYPLAYMNGDRGSREAPWNEEEEAKRADVWKEKLESETTRLQDEMRKNLEKIEDLASLLASYAEDVSHVGMEPDNLDNDFDEILEAKDPRPLLRAMSGSHVVHLARHARSRVQEAAMEERAELERKLKETCPPRSVRDFRMVRFCDARSGRREPARTGMLNVWDAAALGNELVEGKRYLVSNLIPGKNGDWKKPVAGAMTEVYLHTRRETRWKAVEVPEPQPVVAEPPEESVESPKSAPAQEESAVKTEQGVETVKTETVKTECGVKQE